MAPPLFYCDDFRSPGWLGIQTSGQNILVGDRFFKNQSIMKLDKAKWIADGIVRDLSPFCEHCLIAGSVRRESEEVKDVEIVLKRAPNNSFPLTLTSMIKSLGTIKKGDPLKGRYVQVHHHAGIMVDIFIPQPNDFWRIFAMRTGPRSYSQNTIARGWVNIGWVGTEDGLRLSNQCARHGKAGVWKCHVKDPVLPPSWASEEEFFEWLDVPFKDPKDRGVVLEEDIHPRLDIYQKIEAGHFTPVPEEVKPVIPFAELSEKDQGPFLDLAGQILGGLLCCTRTWSAWGVGTMTEHDFVEAGMDDDLIFEKAEMIYRFAKSMNDEG